MPFDSLVSELAINTLNFKISINTLLKKKKSFEQKKVGKKKILKMHCFGVSKNLQLMQGAD